MDGSLFPPMIGKYRSRTEIAATILTVARDGKMQIRIMEQSHLNSRRLRFYLGELLMLGLIGTSSANGNKTYITSEKGLQYLTQYNRISSMLR
jgi:predicted transcriptional regulator